MRKRKIALKNQSIERKLNNDRKEIMKILSKVQTNEVLHKNYAKELRELYEKVSSELLLLFTETNGEFRL